jgi:hypothetical protein
VGFSSGTIYSAYFREVISMATIDVELAKIGTEVIVQWGDHGRRMKNVRATVERFPYLCEGRNDQVDTSKVASATAYFRKRKLGSCMKKREIDHVLRAAGRITGEKQFIIIGSQSLHGKYPDLADDIVRSVKVDLLAAKKPGRTEW